MKREKYLTTLIIMCVVSYIMMVNLSVTADAQDIANFDGSENVVRRDTLITTLRDVYINEIELIKYIQNVTNLEYDDCEFIVRECKDKKLDPFIVLGVIKRESNFNPLAKGEAGERGLGQLMENTARPIAENLGYIYDSDKLYETRYNLKLTIAQINYLIKLYNNDVHKALTAYNRGQQGLMEYMENNHTYTNPAVSEYSLKVLEFVDEFKIGFNNSKNNNS